MTNDKVNASSAATTLRDTDELAARTRRDGLWYARYLTVFAVGFAAMTLLLGLGPQRTWWVAVLLGVWAVVVTAMVVWAGRRPVRPKIPPRYFVPGWIGTGTFYGVALFVGLDRDLPPWLWLVAAVVVALPLLLSAWGLRRSVA